MCRGRRHRSHRGGRAVSQHRLARLTVLLESESLLNDGTAIVFFTLVLGLVQGGGASPVTLASDFIRIVGLGGAIGAVVGLGVTELIRRVEDPMLEHWSLTTVAAYGSFVAAEQFGVSGVIATVVADDPRQPRPRARRHVAGCAARDRDPLGVPGVRAVLS